MAHEPFQIFFAGRFTYRRPRVLFAGLLFLAFGVYALRYLVLGLTHSTSSLKLLGTAVFVGGIGGILAFGGLYLLKRWFTRMCITLEISTAGITYGRVSHSWDAIRWVAGRRVRGYSSRKRVELFYQTRDRGLKGLDRPMPVDQNPTLQEYAELIESLSNAIQEKHPEVVLGYP
jgi:hypothetical protein